MKRRRAATSSVEVFSVVKDLTKTAGAGGLQCSLCESGYSERTTGVEAGIFLVVLVVAVT